MSKTQKKTEPFHELKELNKASIEHKSWFYSALAKYCNNYAGIILTLTFLLFAVSYLTPSSSFKLNTIEGLNT